MFILNIFCHCDFATAMQDATKVWDYKNIYFPFIDLKLRIQTESLVAVYSKSKQNTTFLQTSRKVDIL